MKNSVEVWFRGVRSAYVVVEANSLDEAKQKAEDIYNNQYDTIKWLDYVFSDVGVYVDDDEY